MVDIYSRFGRLREVFEMTLDLLRALQSGEVDIENVVIGDSGWYVKVEEEDEDS